MTLELGFRYPPEIVALDVNDPEAGAALAVETILDRYDVAIPLDQFEDLRQRLTGLTKVLVEGEADAGFALVPSPPLIGVVGWIAVRWREATGRSAVADAMAESLSGAPFLVEDPAIEIVQTPIGEATRVIHRYTNDDPAKFTQKKRLIKRSMVVIEHICWYWNLPDPHGDDLLLTVTTTTPDISIALALRSLIEEFALGIAIVGD